MSETVALMKLFVDIGKYTQFMKLVLKRPQKWRVSANQLVQELNELGVNSVGIVSLMSIFMGAVITLQTAANIDSPLIPAYTIGFTTRESILLEFSPTIIALILAGKVGSSVASQLGTMKITEQIDALTMMGVKSASFLVMPKIVAAVFFFPFLITLSMVLAIFGGWMFGTLAGVVATADYIDGIRFDFDSFSYTYAMIKTVVFAFLITSISAYNGFYAKGSALEVSKSSTRAVVSSSIAILVSNYLITQILLL